ncbi:hypothetical protein [Amycolatopsis sp. YIM 10]|uniref:hypothetical protein n=1 Tax=Amycolatopsis sp. YIM 10 TaxID=2653857 RepID=UPI00129043B4|nr:hypothetical protein [Amycolatopsis sp. YIM 10]QFU85393.1 hypothetical protein YIM_00800 [Amycolatopsis sp. YIM 10]
MGFREELREPWGLLLAGTSAGVAWAVQLPPVAAAGVGVAVLLARAAIAGFDRKPEPPAETTLTGEEATYFERAERARESFAAIGATLPPGPLVEQIPLMASMVAETAASLRRLAERSSATRDALGRIDTGELAAEEKRLRRRGNDEATLRALNAVRDQRDVAKRLTDLRAKLLGELHAGTLDLESLVARVVELSATADPAPSSGTSLDGLAEQLEAIRRGVVEADEAARRVLGS